MSMSCIKQILHCWPVVLLLAGCSAPALQPTEPTPTTAAAKSEAIDASPAEVEIAKYSLALGYLKANRFDEAQERFTEIADKHPDLAGPLANLGLIAIKKNQFDRATELLNKAITKNPNLAQAHHLLGYIENKRGNYLKARDAYQKAVTLRPDYALAQYNLALLYDVYLRDIPKAVEHYEKYLALIKNEDKRTADWVNELKATMKKG